MAENRLILTGIIIPMLAIIIIGIGLIGGILTGYLINFPDGGQCHSSTENSIGNTENVTPTVESGAKKRTLGKSIN